MFVYFSGISRILLSINRMIMFLIIYLKWPLNSSTDMWDTIKSFSLSDLHSQNPKKMFWLRLQKADTWFFPCAHKEQVS